MNKIANNDFQQILENYAGVARIIKIQLSPKSPESLIEVHVINASGETRKDVWAEVCGVITPNDWDSPNVVDKPAWEQKNSFLVKD
jgi:hypothetical protein